MVWSTPGRFVAVALGTIASVAPFVLAGVAFAADAPSPASPSSVTSAAVHAPARTAPSSAVTSVSTGIKITLHVKGGTLQLSSDQIEVTLQATSPGHLVGRYEDVRVLDARGTSPGWQLIARASAPKGSLRVTPDPTEPVEGSLDGLLDAPTADVDSNGALLGGATVGHGAGVYALSGLVELDLDGGSAPGSVVLSLELR